MFYYTRHFYIFCIVFSKYIPEGLHEKAIGLYNNYNNSNQGGIEI